ncbi:DELTA-thalatoxin-Avl1b-like [Xenopus tropicalis]|nr:DELTA-thalatoxin-Avl1b-like [Xenopus tropicalis]
METSMDKLLSKVDSEKCVGIEISNKSSSIILSCPSTYCDSGRVHSQPSPSILPGTVDRCVFVRTPSAARGSVGVLTYQLSGNYTLAIFFSNPYSYVLHKVHLGLWIYAGTDKPIKNVYKEMKDNRVSSRFYKHCDIGNETQTLEVSNDNVRVLATMTNTKKAVLRVHILNNNAG